MTWEGVLTNLTVNFIIRGMVTKRQLKRRDRNATIKVYYENLPPGLRSMRRMAEIFGVSRSTILYAVNGRRKDNNHE
jgi:hypothetical protein